MATASATVYASRSISWDTTTLANGTVIQGGVIFPDASVEERSDDDSVITENPVETGSVTNDHAYDLPQELELTYAWPEGSSQANGQPGFLDQMYQQLLTLKQAKVLLNVVTGKRQYQYLLIKSLSVATDQHTENVLLIRILLRQLLLAIAQVVTIAPASQQTMPEKTMPTINGGAVSLQPAPNFNPGTPTGS
jgi:hypothetical protein